MVGFGWVTSIHAKYCTFYEFLLLTSSDFKNWRSILFKISEIKDLIDQTRDIKNERE
jgi:hypothetical protein